MAAATQSNINPFEHTAPGQLGANRESMLTNELLLRNELGRPRVRGYAYMPSEEFVYGRPNEARHGGADDALHGWPRSYSSTTLPINRKQRQPERDFMSLNRAAVQNGLVTASENYKFRATHDVRRKTAGDENTRTRTRRLPPTMVFGISTRPSTPVFDLLEHKYQDQWLADRRQAEMAKRQEESKMPSFSAGPLRSRNNSAGSNQRRKPNTVYETRASLLRTYQNPVDEAPLWQLPKFRDTAKPSLQTFRSARARETAYDQFESDQISRKGKLGHGVYDVAQN